jgi:hypothetical protein
MDRIIDVNKLIDELDMSLYKYLDIHHTLRPSHSSFNGDNYFKLQDGMRNYHINTKGWRDIAQHVSLAPDGLYITGRDFTWTPVSINYNLNRYAFMVEMIGNFDIDHDILDGEQLRAILILMKHFIDNGKLIRFHNEYSYKSCPGSSLNKGGMIDMALNTNNWKDWQVSLAIESIKDLANEGFLNNPEMHIAKIEKENKVDEWLLLVIMDRMAKKNKANNSVDIDALAEEVSKRLKIVLDKN